MNTNGEKQYRTLLSVETLGEVVREYRPARRTIRFRGRDKLIQTPYMIFAYKAGVLYVAVAKAPIRDLGDKVYFSPFGNTWRDHPDYGSSQWGRVCGAHGTSLDEAIRLFWQTEFNVDLSWGQIVRERTFGSYREWAELSARPDAEQRVLDRIEYDSIPFSSFISIYSQYWGKWQTYLNENVQNVVHPRRRPKIKTPLNVFPASCESCKARFVCPGSVLPANLNLTKIMWNKIWGAIKWCLRKVRIRV